MVRLTQLDDVLFPVEERPVFVRFGEGDGAKTITVPQRRAIIDRESGRVLGLVSKDYRLVTNRQALEWGRDCCRAVFPDTKPSEWEVKATDAPATRGYCRIDFTHNTEALDFDFLPAKDRPDAFAPFIRVTNSYNGKRALAFDIGFRRKVCANGLILKTSIIQFKFSHVRQDIATQITFCVEHERLAAVKRGFTKYLGRLRDCTIPRAKFEPFMYGVLLIRKPMNLNEDKAKAADWSALTSQIHDLCDRYAGELGENAYAVFNAMTDFASQPPANRCTHRERHSYQKLAGKWLSEFNRECREPDFKIDDYLNNLGTAKGDSSTTNHAERIRHPR